VTPSYLSPKAEARTDAPGDTGLYAVEPIAAGELVAAFGGRCVDRDEFDRLSPDVHHQSIQIGERLYLVGDPSPGNQINHSCAPNCGIAGNVSVIAMREIEAGEELTYDYAMSDGSDFDQFECTCSAPECRGKVTGSDWMLPELHERYAGYFSDYLRRRIEGLAYDGPQRRAFFY
jgi:hypothetical protein